MSGIEMPKCVLLHDHNHDEGHCVTEFPADRSAAEALSTEEERFVREHRDITRFGHGYVGDLSMAGGLIDRLFATLDRERAAALPDLAENVRQAQSWADGPVAAALPTLEVEARPWTVDDELVLVRKGSGGVLMDGTTNHPDVEALRAAIAQEGSPVGLDDRIEFRSFDGRTLVRTGQGDHCVMVQVLPDSYAGAGVVFTDDEAEAFGRSLIRRAEYSRAALSDDVSPGVEP